MSCINLSIFFPELFVYPITSIINLMTDQEYNNSDRDVKKDNKYDNILQELDNLCGPDSYAAGHEYDLFRDYINEAASDTNVTYNDDDETQHPDVAIALKPYNNILDDNIKKRIAEYASKLDEMDELAIELEALRNNIIRDVKNSKKERDKRPEYVVVGRYFAARDRNDKKLQRRLYNEIKKLVKEGKFNQ